MSTSRRELEFEALRRMVKELEDPRAATFLFLLEAHRPISKTQISELLQTHELTTERALRWLYQRHLIEKLHPVTSKGKEAFYFALVQ